MKALKSGFTLIELLIVTVIITTLVSLGFANYRDYSRRQTLNSAVRQMEGDIRLAQSMAFAGKKPAGCSVLDGYKVKFSVVNNLGYYSLYAACSGGVDIAVPGKIDLTVPWEKGISFYGGQTWVIFKTLGQGTSRQNGGGDITVTFYQVRTGYTATLVITTSGEVTANFK